MHIGIGSLFGFACNPQYSLEAEVYISAIVSEGGLLPELKLKLGGLWGDLENNLPFPAVSRGDLETEQGFRPVYVKVGIRIELEPASVAVEEG
jgi:hypothetical protein